MIAESTIRKQEAALRGVVTNEKHNLERTAEAYAMATALQWVLGGCSWNLISLNKDTGARR